MQYKPKENLLLVRHVVNQFLIKGDLSSYENYIAQDVQVHCPSSWQEIHSSEIENHDNTKVIDQEYAQAFQFSEVNFGNILTHQDKICVHWQGSGVHKGDFFSIPASHRSFSVTGQTIWRIDEEGKIVEVWQAWDMLGLLKGIGINFKRPQASIKELDLYLKKASRLSERERECLRQFLHGKTSKETAAELFLSFRTIEYYFENIKDKLGCSSKRELYRLARLFESHHLL